jgi:phage terminase small subunit
MPNLRQPKHEQFAREIVAGAAVKDAYTAAGFKPHRANGNRLLRRPEIAARIDELQREAGARAEITADRVIIEIGRVAFGNLAAFIEWKSKDGTSGDCGKLAVRDITALPEAVTASLQELKIDDEGAVTVKLAPKLPALERLAELIGAGRQAGSIFTAQRPDNERLDIETLKRALANVVDATAVGEVSMADGAKIADALAIIGRTIETEKLAEIEAKLRAIEGAPMIDQSRSP